MVDRAAVIRVALETAEAGSVSTDVVQTHDSVNLRWGESSGDPVGMPSHWIRAGWHRCNRFEPNSGAHSGMIPALPIDGIRKRK